MRRAIPGLAMMLLLAGCLPKTAPGELTEPGAVERRQQLLLEDVSTDLLVQSLQDGNVLVRRTAVRRLAERNARAQLLSAMADSDLLVRRTALAALIGSAGTEALQALELALADSSSLVRLLAVEHLAGSRPHTARVLELLDAACRDPDDKVREIATRATWPFFRNAPSVRDGGTDLDITVAEAIRLPRQGWRFQLDPQREGHRQGWFGPQYADDSWPMIDIEQVWQQAGYQYTGVTWYRRSFELPAEPESFSVDIAFGGVDESAWIWINGVYAGDHDIGPSGWNVPFRLDVTQLLRWGESNDIAVRAMNTAHGGGIWKPIDIEVLQR